MREHFIDYKPKADAAGVIDHANTIIDDYQARGLMLSVRQIYYRLVALDLFPVHRLYSQNAAGKWIKDEINGTNNAPPNYMMLKDVLNRARLAGMIDWETIEDRARRWEYNNHWDCPSDFMRTANELNWYAVDKWASHDVLVEVWIEKNALIGVLESVCKDLDVRYYACVGYNSASMQYEAAKRFQAWRKSGRRPVVIHLGDHDPSGLDMTRDNTERLELMSGGPVEVNRIALNMDQIEELNPPPNNAKDSDARTPQYVRTFGTENCWELDAIDPNDMATLVQTAVLKYRDEDLFQEQLELEENGRERLREIQEQLEDEEN